MWFLRHRLVGKLDCTNPLPAITLNLETFKQAMSFALFSLPLFTLGGLLAWSRNGSAVATDYAGTDDSRSQPP